MDSTSLIGASSLPIVTGILNPKERVNTLLILVAAGCLYAVSYRFYSSFLSARVISLDSRNMTPSKRLRDGIDYHPTNRWVLFGHHFAAIAGLGLAVVTAPACDLRDQCR